MVPKKSGCKLSLCEKSKNILFLEWKKLFPNTISKKRKFFGIFEIDFVQNTVQNWLPTEGTTKFYSGYIL